MNLWFYVPNSIPYHGRQYSHAVKASTVFNGEEIIGWLLCGNGTFVSVLPGKTPKGL